MEKVFLTVIGKNEAGVVAAVSQTLLAYKISIADITQKILDDKFVLFMILECRADLNIPNLQKHLEQSTRQFRLKFMIAHEELFNSMHRI
jgi:ACT domain-containing protein